MTPEILTAILMAHGSPGQTALSVESADYCMRAFPPANCAEKTVWSDFYGTWVHKERRETAEKRISLASRALIEEAQQLLCVAGDGSKLEGCTPYPGVMKGKRRRWTVDTLGGLGSAIAQYESGYREDVMVGRGWAKKASDDGGMGRGPGWEGCLMQIHPNVAWQFADAEPLVRLRASRGDKAAREEIVQSLLGSDEESLRRCWRTGLRMLIRARAHCDWWLWDLNQHSKIDLDNPVYDWDYMTVSMYGTGNSCSASNGGKTDLRVRFFRTVIGEINQSKKMASK